MHLYNYQISQLHNDNFVFDDESTFFTIQKSQWTDINQKIVSKFLIIIINIIDSICCTYVINMLRTIDVANDIDMFLVGSTLLYFLVKVGNPLFNLLNLVIWSLGYLDFEF